jgi:valyl-tRNA synthetase
MATTLNFDQDTLREALKSALIIEQQQEILNECLGKLAEDFGVNKSIAKKIIFAFAKDKMEKTQEKIEEERTSLSNAEVMLEVVENITIDTEKILEEGEEESEKIENDVKGMI